MHLLLLAACSLSTQLDSGQPDSGQLDSEAVEGETVFFVVDSVAGQEGAYYFNVDCNPPGAR